MRACSGKDGKSCTPIYCVHPRNVQLFVELIILDQTQSIYPKILQIRALNEFDCIENCLGNLGTTPFEATNGYEILVVLLEQSEARDSGTPNVAKDGITGRLVN